MRIVLELSKDIMLKSFPRDSDSVHAAWNPAILIFAKHPKELKWFMGNTGVPIKVSA